MTVIHTGPHPHARLRQAAQLNFSLFDAVVSYKAWPVIHLRLKEHKENTSKLRSEKKKRRKKFLFILAHL